MPIITPPVPISPAFEVDYSEYWHFDNIVSVRVETYYGTTWFCTLRASRNYSYYLQSEIELKLETFTINLKSFI
jgi:hypothetical protein